ncbi:MAG: four-carbon acid sugar kinase family protein [Sphaerochaeta sp.]|nr:four-carbon acid sugar kinase family protein [Sphaerochaeta sp.]
MEQILRLVIADDLTGANDTGVHFLSDQAAVVVIVDPSSADFDPKDLKAPTIVVNTNSRSLSPENAFWAVQESVEKFAFLNPREIFKKIDSTLRGNVGAEIDAVMGASGFRVACVAPATPRNGRTVRDGLCYVNGIPLAVTEVANDPFTPVQGSDVRMIIASQTDRTIGLLPLEIVRSTPEVSVAFVQSLIATGIEIIVADTMTIEDLRAVRTTFLALEEPVLYVGSAGFFHALGVSSEHSGSHSGLKQGDSQRILMVVGSMMETSVAQVTWLSEQVRLHEIHRLITEQAIADSRSEIDRLVSAVCEGFSTSRLVLLQTDRDNSRLSGHVIVGSVLGKVVDAVLRSMDIDVLVVTGGDTAMHILKGLKVNELELIDESLPGIPVGRIMVPGIPQPIVFISKAGSFGEPDALEGVFEYIQNKPTTQVG